MNCSSYSWTISMFWPIEEKQRWREIDRRTTHHTTHTKRTRNTERGIERYWCIQNKLPTWMLWTYKMESNVIYLRKRNNSPIRCDHIVVWWQLLVGIIHWTNYTYIYEKWKLLLNTKHKTLTHTYIYTHIQSHADRSNTKNRNEHRWKDACT